MDENIRGIWREVANLRTDLYEYRLIADRLIEVFERIAVASERLAASAEKYDDGS